MYGCHIYSIKWRCAQRLKRLFSSILRLRCHIHLVGQRCVKLKFYPLGRNVDAPTTSELESGSTVYVEKGNLMFSNEQMQTCWSPFTNDMPKVCWGFTQWSGRLPSTLAAQSRKDRLGPVKWVWLQIGSEEAQLLRPHQQPHRAAKKRFHLTVCRQKRFSRCTSGSTSFLSFCGNRHAYKHNQACIMKKTQYG